MVMKQLFCLVAAALLIGCSSPQTTITLTNPSSINRVDEVVKVDITQLNLSTNLLIVQEKESGIEVQSQLIDVDNDGKPDQIVLQTSLKSNESKQYIISEGQTEIKASDVKTYARFVPERTDDFAWENDKVAFRTYGPEAQRLVEVGEPGGTLSSGIDCWLKKVDYSIINGWYKKNSEKAGAYHIDHGEGLDNYHVGPSRGCGGTGVMLEDTLYTSKNFVSYKVLENGPLHTAFELDYAEYMAGDKLIKERKLISIDQGNNFTRYEIYVEGTDILTTGLTLHDLQGAISSDEKGAWINYHTPHQGEKLSTAIVAHPKYLAKTSTVESEVKDESHALMHLNVIDGKVIFYSGFYWSGSNQFNDNSAWESYLNEFSETIKQPILVDVK